MLLANISEGSRLQNFLHTPAARRANMESAAGESDGGAIPHVRSSLTSNLSQLSGVLDNMRDDGSGESKYIRATKASLNASRRTVMQQDAVLAAAVTEVNNLTDRGYAERIRVGKKAARAMGQEMERSASEHSERNLEEIKKDIEDKAQEATAPKDADGKPVTESERASSTAEPAVEEVAHDPEPSDQQAVSEQSMDEDAAVAPLRADVADVLAAYVSVAADASGEQTALRNAVDATA